MVRLGINRKEVRCIVDILRTRNWKLIQSSHHVVMDHPTGCVIRISKTPSCPFFGRKVLAEAERKIRKSRQ